MNHAAKSKHILLFCYTNFLFAKKVSAVSVCSLKSSANLLGSYFERHVVESVALCASSNSNSHQLFVGNFGDAQFLEGYGQTQFNAEADDLFKLIAINIFKNKLGNGAESNLFAVIHMVAFGKNGKAVVDSVCACKTAAFKTTRLLSTAAVISTTSLGS